jgi:hypothetical protein
MQRFCRKLGIRPYRPTYRLLRGDAVKQAKPREELADLKEGAGAGEPLFVEPGRRRTSPTELPRQDAPERGSSR